MEVTVYYMAWSKIDRFIAEIHTALLLPLALLAHTEKGYVNTRLL